MEYPSFNMDVKDNYKFIDFDESLKLSGCRHVAHCCLYSPHSFLVDCKDISCKAYVSMQLRSDGSLGFPGGFTKNRGEIVSERAEIIDNLNRELLEESNLDEKHYVSEKDYMFTMLCDEGKIICHFFAKEVSIEDFMLIERNALDAEHYGTEVFGNIRVPLFLKPDKRRGFPAFLTNLFVSCSKYQLLCFLLKTKLMSYDEIEDCIERSKTITNLL